MILKSADQDAFDAFVKTSHTPNDGHVNVTFFFRKAAEMNISLKKKNESR